eukprot:128846_1
MRWTPCQTKNNTNERALEQKRLDEILKATKWCTLQRFYMLFMIPVVLISIGASGLLIGVIVASETLGLAISAPVIGTLLNNRSNVSWVITIGCLLKSLSIGIILAGFSFESPSLILIGSFITGTTRTCIRDGFRLLIADHTPFGNRSQYLGKLRQQMGIGMFIGCFVGFAWLFIASQQDIPWNDANLPNEWWFKTIVGMVFFMLGNVYTAFVLPKQIKLMQSEKMIPENTCTSNTNESVDECKTETTSTVEVTTDTAKSEDNWTAKRLKHGFIGLLLLLGFEQLVGSLIRPFIIVFLEQKFNEYNEQHLIIAYAPGGILSVIIAPIIGRILDHKIKILPRYTLCIASFIGSLITVALIYATSLVQVIFIIIGDFTVLTVAGLSLEKMISAISKSHRGSVLGATTFVEQICTMLGPIIGGLLWDYISHTTPFWASVVVESMIGITYVVFFSYFPFDAMVQDRE